MSEAQQEDQGVEAQIQALGLTAPRVTPEQIDALMDRVECIGTVIGDTTTVVHAFLDQKFYLGSAHSSCVSPENFNEELGLDIARKKIADVVRNKLWELEGYRLYMDIQISMAAAEEA